MVRNLRAGGNSLTTLGRRPRPVRIPRGASVQRVHPRGRRALLPQVRLAARHGMLLLASLPGDAPAHRPGMSRCLRREAPRRAHEPRRREGRYQVSRVVILMIAFLETAQAQAQASYVAGSPVPLPPLASVLQPLASSACRQRIRAAPARNGSSQRVHSWVSDTAVLNHSRCPSIARGKQHYTPQQAASCRSHSREEMH